MAARLIHATDPLKIEQLQNRTGMSQADAVDYLIETFGAYDLLDWMGLRGSPSERLEAIRASIKRYHRE